MQVESSATPLSTKDKASSLPGQFCPFHPRSTLELVEKAQGFSYVYCPEKMCFMFAPASEWKEYIERIAHHTHSDVKRYAAQLVCDCSNKLALRKSKQPWSQDRMFLTCHKKECNFFMWIDQPISHAIKGRLSYSPQPRFTRFHPYREIKEMFENHRQEVKQKGLIQRQRHARKYDEGFLMCDNGFNSLGSPKIFHGLRYRKWMDEVWESYKFYVQKMKEDSRDDPDPSLCLDKDDLLRQAYFKYASDDGHHPESFRVLKVLYERHIEGKHVPFEGYVISPEEHEEIERDKQLSSYSRAFARDLRRSKCIAMLNNIRNQDLPVCSN